MGGRARVFTSLVIEELETAGLVMTVRLAYSTHGQFYLSLKSLKIHSLYRTASYPRFNDRNPYPPHGIIHYLYSRALIH